MRAAARRRRRRLRPLPLFLAPRRSPPAAGRRRARLFPPPPLPRAAPCAPAPSAISVGPWPPFSLRLCVSPAAWLGSCERSFVRFGNGRVGNEAGEEVCGRGVGPAFGPVRGRAETPRRSLPRAGLPLPNPRPIAHTPPWASPWRALVEKTGRKRARGHGRRWGDGGATTPERQRAPAGRRGMGSGGSQNVSPCPAPSRSHFDP